MIVTTCQDIYSFSKVFFTPVLPEAKLGMGVKLPPFTSHIQSLGGLGGKPGSRPPLKEQAVSSKVSLELPQELQTRLYTSRLSLE